MKYLFEIGPIILLFIAFYSVGLLILHFKPVEVSANRDIQIDGLRSLLAFGVISFHFFGVKALIYQGTLDYFRVSKVVQQLGVWTVPMFFTITAYLFGGRLFQADNQSGRAVVRFFVGRFFRLVPTTVTLIAFVIVFLSGWKWSLESWSTYLNAASSSILQPVARTPSFVNSSDWMVLTGPMWTLHYEWMFYFLLGTLPLLTLRKRNVFVSIFIIAFLLVCVPDIANIVINWNVTWAFVPGLLLGVTRSFWSCLPQIKQPYVGVLAVIFCGFSVFSGAVYLQVLANTLFLAVIISRNQITRFLEALVLRSLGEATYSMYLYHGLVQYIAYKYIVTIPIARSLPEWIWWITCAIEVAVIVIISRLSYEYVEKPGIELGKRFYVALFALVERKVKWLLLWI